MNNEIINTENMNNISNEPTIEPMKDKATTEVVTKKRRGRPKLSEEEKLARKQAKEKEEEISKSTDVAETCVTYTQGDSFLRFYSTQRKGKNFIKRMLEEYPDVCKPLLYDDGECVQISMPPEALWYIRVPSKREMTDKQREELKERAKKMQEARKNKKNKEDI